MGRQLLILSLPSLLSPSSPIPYREAGGERETPCRSACPHSDANPLPSAFYLWGRLRVMPLRPCSQRGREENPSAFCALRVWQADCHLCTLIKAQHTPHLLLFFPSPLVFFQTGVIHRGGKERIQRSYPSLSRGNGP